MIGFGVAAGAQISVQPTASKPGTPASAMVGTSGSAGTRVVERHAERTHPAGVDLADDAAGIGEHHRDMARHHVVEAGRRAAIGDAVHLGAGHRLEQFGGEMDRRARSAVGKIDLARLLLEQRDQFGNGFHRQVWD